MEALAVVAQRVDDATLDRFPNLRLVANYGAGYDLVDVGACRARGIAVTNTPDVTAPATADLTFGLILAVLRRIAAGDRVVRSGVWKSGWADEPLKGDEVTGATLGIVGLGRIGRAVAQRARGFEMRVLHTRRTPDGEPGYRPLDELLAEVHVVSLHVPLTDETHGFIDARRLALMRDGACLVNTSRGPVVDERALVDELVSGRLQAGLDVFANEPDVPQELHGLDNVVMTPHLGTATQATRKAMTRVLVDNLLAVARGEQPPNAV
ncbi:MAG TPA: D-glycerate dehydrogenase [Gaiellaceae bacterium]|nr:D-glycerate dehydrogenase [Gaiellaceae bacterium]HET8653567.1 D-glycerate dehydrogenase [Gaiellaceae bacterium]